MKNGGRAAPHGGEENCGSGGGQVRARQWRDQDQRGCGGGNLVDGEIRSQVIDGPLREGGGGGQR
jgi:hypothetical protein